VTEAEYKVYGSLNLALQYVAQAKNEEDAHDIANSFLHTMDISSISIDVAKVDGSHVALDCKLFDFEWYHVEIENNYGAGI